MSSILSTVFGRAFWAVVFLTACIRPAVAGGSDAVTTDGILSDSDLYHLATCGAQPDGDCSGPYVRWGSDSVTVAMLPAQPGFPRALTRNLSGALDRAIAEINGAGSGLRLKRRDSRAEDAQIVLTPSGLDAGARAKGLTNINNGAEIGVGYMAVYWTPSRRITRAGIAIAADIAADEIDSVVLEELFQTLGFIFDIDNPAYEGVSILSENSNLTTRIRGQDRDILRLHYPPL